MSNKNTIIQQIENAQLKESVPPFAPGDTIVVQVKVKEGKNSNKKHKRKSGKLNHKIYNIRKKLQ